MKHLQNTRITGKQTLVYVIMAYYIFIVSCTNAQIQNKNHDMNSIIGEINKEYVKTKSFFNESYVKHFPQELDSSYIAYTDCVSPEVGELKLILTYKLVNNNLINIFANKAIATYHPMDSCLLVVNRFATKDNFYNVKVSNEEKHLINRSCYGSLFPIPNFWDNKFSTDQTLCKLSKDFVIYVLDSKAGKYLEDKLLTDGRFMPNKWKNGISKGVAINEKEKIIIYWMIVW